jgi:hypothetical protein
MDISKLQAEDFCTFSEAKDRLGEGFNRYRTAVMAAIELRDELGTMEY